MANRLPQGSALLTLGVLLAVCTVAYSRNLQDAGVGVAMLGGTDATKGRYTHFASLRRYNVYSPYCGGVVINYGTRDKPGALTGRLVLTAAHCLGNGWARIANGQRNPVIFANSWYNDAPAANPNPADDSVMTGQFPPIQPATDYQNAVVFRTSYGSWYHPSYEGYSGGANAVPPYAPDANKYLRNHNDVALLLLDSQIGPPSIPSMLLPAADKPKAGLAGGTAAGTTLRLVGFGASTPGGNQQRNLKQGDFPLLDLATCNSSQLYHDWDELDGTVAQTPFEYAWFPWRNNTKINGNSVRPNSFICAGGANYPVASCTGDSGGPVFIPDAANNPNADELVGLVSYGKYYKDGDLYQMLGCNYKPKVFTDVASVNDWIRYQIGEIEKTYFQYTIDIFLYDDNNKKYYSGTFPFSVQKELGAYLSWLIGKKPTLAGSVPRSQGGPYNEIQVNYYSYKGADKNGRLRFMFTSKKTFEQVSKYFQTGSYNTTCDNKGAFDFEGAKNCTQGPFSSAIWQNSFWKILSKSVSYYKNALTDMEKIIQKGIDDEETVQLTIKNIEVWNGYGTKPNCVAGSGVNACKRLIRFCTKGLPDNTCIQDANSV